MAKSKERIEFDNLQALIDFKNAWDDKGPSLEASGLGLHFHAQVTYTSPKRNTTDLTNVRAYLSGFSETGMIDIDETRGMTVDLYHLRISRSFGSYEYDEESGELIITNTSQKMGGKYTISILPVGRPQ